MKIRKIKVQTVDTVPPSTIDKTGNPFVSFNEPSNNAGGNFAPVNVTDSPNSTSRKSFSTACRQDVWSTSDRRVKNEDPAQSHYGDLVIIDLGSSTEQFVHE